MAIIAGVCILCIMGVMSKALLIGLQRRVIPQGASIAHLSCLVTRLETLFFEALCPPRVWSTNCGVDEEHWCCERAALLSESSCSVEYTAESPFEDENKTTGTPPPCGWKGCEASNIIIIYFVLSKVQHHVGISVLRAPRGLDSSG